MEVDFGGVCFIRHILKGCRGRFFNMEAGVGGRFQYGGRFLR
jgi:hypothetical protein